MEESNFLYQAAVGALMSLMVGTRPNLAYSVVVSRVLENSSKVDSLKVKRIFCYLKDTIDKDIVYSQITIWVYSSSTQMQIIVMISRLEDQPVVLSASILEEQFHGLANDNSQLLSLQRLSLESSKYLL